MTINRFDSILLCASCNTYRSVCNRPCPPCERLHIQYSYDDHSVVVANNLYSDYSGLIATAAVYDFDLQQEFLQRVKLDAPADSVQKILVLPPSTDSNVYFVKLTLQRDQGEVLSSNFYWLSGKPSVFDWDRTNDHGIEPLWHG